MRIGILTTESEKDADTRLCEAALKRGHEPLLLNVMKCSISVSEDAPHVYHEGSPIEDEIDVIIPRIDIPHTDFGLAVLRQFQAMEIHTTDLASAIEVGRNKLLCLQYLMRRNLPMPVTGFAYTRQEFLRLLEEMGGVPVVIKLVEGTEGNGVFLAKGSQEALAIFDKYNKTGMRVIVQEFILESAGTDIRSFVVGGKIVANMRRVAKGDEFRANIALGAEAFDETLSAEEEAMVLKAVSSIGINIAGVDFIRSRRGPLLVEINTSPGFTGERGIEAVTGADIAGSMVDYAVKGHTKAILGQWYKIPPSQLKAAVAVMR